MKTKLRLIIFSHLSDVQEDLNHPDNVGKINFVKWLMLKYTDLNIDIDPDKEFEEFLSANKNRAWI